MRRALLMVGVMMVVFLAAWGGPRVASATQTCTATCSGGSTLSCTVATGTCSKRERDRHLLRRDPRLRRGQCL